MMKMETQPNQIIKIEIDNSVIEELVKQGIKERIEEQTEKLFYDMQDLQNITSFSQGHIKNTFFYDPRFERIRKKVGKKHVFPVEATNKFLLEWIEEQPTN